MFTGENQIAAHNANIALLEIAFTLARGMGESTSIRVAYHLGRGYVYVCVCICVYSYNLHIGEGYGGEH